MNLEIFEPLRAEITKAMGACLSIEVTSKDEERVALENAQTVKSLQKRIESRRKELLEPLNEQIRLINDTCRTIAEPLIASEAHLRSELIRWEKQLAEVRIAEKANILEAASLFSETPHIDPEIAKDLEAIESMRVKGTSKTWAFEVIEESLVPRTLCKPDLTKIRIALKYGARDIPGLRIFQETRIAIRGLVPSS